MESGAPKRYLSRLQSKAIMEDSEFDSVLATHELEPEYLLTSHWQAFFADRAERFIGMIEYAMDKPVVRDGNVSAWNTDSEDSEDNGDE